jgi:hypothetical protein
MTITVATVIGNVCLTRSGIHILATLTHLVVVKPDRTPAVKSVHHLSRAETRHQNAVATKPYVEMCPTSNQQKAEFVGPRLTGMHYITHISHRNALHHPRIPV